MNLNNTDHYLLSATREDPKRSATTFELTSLTVVTLAVIALSGFLI